VVFVKIQFLLDVIFSVPLTFENGSTTFLRNVKDKATNDRLMSLTLSDTEAALCSVRYKSVHAAAANGELPVQRTVGADW
jgi:hypothetical protein